MKSGNLNFVEPSGPLQACNGTALPLCGAAMYVKYDACSKMSLSVTIFVWIGNFPLNAALLLISMYLKTVIFINMYEFYTLLCGDYVQIFEELFVRLQKVVY